MVAGVSEQFVRLADGSRARSEVVHCDHICLITSDMRKVECDHICRTGVTPHCDHICLGKSESGPVRRQVTESHDEQSAGASVSESASRSTRRASKQAGASASESGIGHVNERSELFPARSRE